MKILFSYVIASDWKERGNLLVNKRDCFVASLPACAGRLAMTIIDRYLPRPTCALKIYESLVHNGYMNSRWKLKGKLLGVQLVAIIPLLLFIFYLFDLWYDVRRTLVVEGNISDARKIGEYIKNSFRYSSIASGILANDDNFYKLLTTDKAKTQERLAKIVEIAPEINNIVITDADGNVMAASLTLTQKQREVNLSDRDYFKEAILGKKEVMSNPLTGRISNIPVVILSTPIVINDKVEAVINTSYNLAILKENIEKMTKSDDNKYIFVLDKNMQLSFYANNPFPDETDKNLFLSEPFVQQIKKEKLSTIENEKLPLTSGSIIGGGVVVENLDWMVISVEPTQHIFAPILKAQKSVWLILLISLFFAAGVISFFLRKVRIVF